MDKEGRVRGANLYRPKKSRPKVRRCHPTSVSMVNGSKVQPAIVLLAVRVKHLKTLTAIGNLERDMQTIQPLRGGLWFTVCVVTVWQTSGEDSEIGG